jgi:hypothetical protein
MQLGNIKALSSACQVVNVTDKVCTACAEKQSRDHVFHATFFKSSLKLHHAALDCITNLII